MFTTSLIAALALSSAHAGDYPRPDPARPCTMITDPMLAEAADTVAAAEALATEDVAANYPDGANALYALYNLRTLQGVTDEISDLRAWLSTGPGEGDPYAVNYSEAVWIMAWLRDGAARPLLYAQWYGVSSAIYHRDWSARGSAELAVEASLQVQTLIGYAMQCYADAYLSGS